jgi:hypothetical protein
VIFGLRQELATAYEARRGVEGVVSARIMQAGGDADGGGQVSLAEFLDWGGSLVEGHIPWLEGQTAAAEDVRSQAEAEVEADRLMLLGERLLADERWKTEQAQQAAAKAKAKAMTDAAAAAAAAGPSAAEYCRHGISAAGLLWFISQLPAGVITADTTTSDVCHMLFKPATVPTGWQCRPTLLNADLRWYSHDYVELLTGNVQATPPLGTRSYCEVLAADPATAHFVGKPTAFLSHGWTYKFEDVVGALASFAAATPGAPEMFFWFDCLSIDEHASQAMSQDWCVG